MKNRYIIFLSFLIAAPMLTLGQQIGQFDQYNKHLMIYNPAATGMEQFTSVDGNFRRQWTGFDNAPRKFLLSVSSRMMVTEYINPDSPYSLYISDNSLYKRVGDPEIKRTPKPHAIGGYILNERHGPINDLSFMGTYAYHLQFTEKRFLALGLGVGVSRKSIDVELLDVIDENDPTYQNYINHDNSNVYFNANFGAVYYSENFYIGYGADQLGRNKVYEEENTENARLILHHNFSAGYNMELSDKLELYPTVLVRHTDPAPLEVDASLRLRIDKLIWFGAGYRNNDAVSGQFGLTISRKLNFGYSYAYSTSDIKGANDGTHEVSLGLMINNSVAAPRLMW